MRPQAGSQHPQRFLWPRSGRAKGLRTGGCLQKNTLPIKEERHPQALILQKGLGLLQNHDQFLAYSVQRHVGPEGTRSIQINNVMHSFLHMPLSTTLADSR